MGDLCRRAPTFRTLVNSGGIRAMTITLTQCHSGGSVELVQGATLHIELPDISATGYRWRVSALDPAILAPASSTAQPATAGGGGVRVIELVARTAGTTPLVLELRRPWDGAGSALERFAITATVH
jgi:predicted secreted protein